MGRALLVLETPVDRQKAVSWIGKAPVGTRVEFKASKRTTPQNDMLWALLTEVSEQFIHAGKKYEPPQWKAIFLHAFGREISFLPSLDEKTFLPIEMSSSDLSKEEMTNFIEFILKEGAERGVVFKNPKEQNSVAAPPETDIEAGDPSPELPASPIHQQWLQNVVKLLWAAAIPGSDIRVLKAQKAGALATYPRPDDCPEIIRGKAVAAYEYCTQVVLKNIEKQDGLALVAGVVGCDQDDLLTRRSV